MKSQPSKISRRYVVTIIVENEAETLAEGLKQARESLKIFKIQDCKPLKSIRTLNQNAALHLFFTQLADELNEKGMDMRTLIRQEVEISWTPYSIKTYLWKPLQQVLLGKKSTTKLNRENDINVVYDNLNRILVERTGGEINIPPFPSIERMMDIDN